MNEDFVPFEIEKRLRSKGFQSRGKEVTHEDRSVYCPSSTISQVLKWLREEKKIFVEIVITPMGLYKPMIYDIGGFKKPYRDISPRIDFEEAALAGIEYCLDNLI